MHFAPTLKQSGSLSVDYTTTKIKINDHEIPEVSETKFLGVIIDNKLNWLPHVEHLYKKLKAAVGILCRIRHYIPTENYKTLYSSLFESHLTYCITVWGGIPRTKIERLFRLQKHCVRILFGDLKTYLAKYETAARTRPIGSQILGPEFYRKEHTKPLFTKVKLLALQNIYNYQCCIELLKILKFRTPMALYNLFKISPRNNSILLILPTKSHHFVFSASKIWNVIAKVLVEMDDIFGSIRIGPFKLALKRCILAIQNKYDEVEWYTTNFDIETIRDLKG